MAKSKPRKCLLDKQRHYGRVRSSGAGDTLFSGVRVYLRNIALVEGQRRVQVASTAFCVLRPSTAVEPRYIFHYVRSQRFVSSLIPLQRGNSPPAVVDADIKAQPLPLPPLSEQRRIVERIDALFAEIAAGEVALAEARKGLDLFRRSLLKSAVTGELTRDWRAATRLSEKGSDFLNTIGTDSVRRGGKSRRRRRSSGESAAPRTELDYSGVPSDWSIATLEELSWASSYGTSIKCAPEATGAPVLRIPNIRNGTLVLDDLKFATVNLVIEQGNFLQPGDLLIIRTNGSEALIGRAGVLIEPLAYPTYFASYLIRFRLLGGERLWRWTSMYFESPVVRQWMQSQIASSAGQYNVSQSSLANLRVPIPPAAEIDEILRRASEALAAADNAEKQLDAAAADAARLKQSILKTAFEGHLAPQDPNDEPASALLDRVAPASRPPRRRGRPARELQPT